MSGKILDGIWIAAKLLVGLLTLIFVYRCSQGTLGDSPRVSNRSAAATSAPAARNPCELSAFKVTGERFRREGERIWITATVTNTGPVACGVQLKATSFDKTGTPLDSSDFWPASIRDIPPGTPEHFKYMLRNDPGANVVELRPIEAKAWAR